MSLTIAMLSKYPPLEGGIAAKTYWLARGLAARGHEVHVITHPFSAGREYRIQDCSGTGLWPVDDRLEAYPTIAELPNLWVHRPEEDIPWHIPEDPEHALALLDLTLRVIREHGVEILDTGYLVPYAIVGHLAKQITGVRHVVRHGGSDIEKFLKKGILGTILTESIAGANVVVTEERLRDLFEPINPCLIFQPPYIPDPKAFAPDDNLEPRGRVAIVGKINYYWKHKGLDRIARIMEQLPDDLTCCVIGQGKGLAGFKDNLSRQLVSRIAWCPFVPPWEVPRLLDTLDAIFIFEKELPFPVFSNLALEALCMGVGIITDREDFPKTYEGLVTIYEGQILTVPSDDPWTAAEMISQWTRNRFQPGHDVRQTIPFEDYLTDNESMFLS